MTLVDKACSQNRSIYLKKYIFYLATMVPGRGDGEVDLEVLRQLPLCLLAVHQD